MSVCLAGGLLNRQEDLPPASSTADAQLPVLSLSKRSPMFPEGQQQPQWQHGGVEGLELPSTQTILQHAQPLESAYLQAGKTAEKHAAKARNNWNKYGAQRYQSAELADANATYLHPAQGSKRKKRARWEQMRDSLPATEYSRESMIPHLKKKAKAYYDASYDAFSDEAPMGRAAVLLHQYAKYARRQEALDGKSSKDAHAMSREYDEKAEEKERQSSSPVESIQSSLSKAGFYASEAAKYRALERNREQREKKMYTVDKALREDYTMPVGGDGIDNMMSSLTLESGHKQGRQASQQQSIRHYADYRAKAEHHEGIRDRQQRKARSYKAQADLSWLMYNAIEYHIPKFASQVAARLEKQGDHTNAALWRATSQQDRDHHLSYRIPSLEQLQSSRARFQHSVFSRPRPAQGNAMLSQYLQDKDQRAWDKVQAVQYSDAPAALRVAHAYKRKAMEKLSNGVDPSSEKAMAGGWLSAADDIEKKAKRLAYERSRGGRNAAAYSLQGIVPGPDDPLSQ